MSYSGSQPTPAEVKAIKRKIRKGTILPGGRYKVLENTTAHGCPLVRNLETDEETHMTLYLHVDGWRP